jgi:aspartate/methionine/tyrosine aminotransferase
VYRECEYDARQRLPSAADLGEKCVTLGAVSKTYGLPGLRIGWLAAHDRELLAKIAALKDYTTICSSAPSEFLAEVALRQRAALITRSLATIKTNLELLDGFFARWAERFRWARPGAGPVGFPQLLGGGVDAFCERLVKRAGVLLLPGSVFDDPGNHFRLGFGRANLPEALGELEKFLEGEK